MKNLIFIILGVYLFLLPWDHYFYVTRGFPFSPSFIFLGLAVLFYLLIVFLNGPKIIIPKFLIPLGFLLVYMTFSLLWTSTLEAGFIRVITIWSYYITVLLIYNLARHFDISYHNLLQSFIMGVLSVGIYSWVVLEMTNVRRFAVGGELNPSHYAALLAFGILASIATYPYLGFPFKVASLSGIIFMCLLLLLTQGRNAIIALTLSIFLSLMVYYISINWSKFKILIKKYRFRAIISYLLIFLLIVATVVTIVNNAGYYERLDNIMLLTELFGGDLDHATNQRTLIWSNYLKILNPIIVVVGGGVDSSRILSGMSTPHNVYMLTFIELGFIGLIFWLVFLVKLAKFALSHKYWSFALLWLAIFIPIFGVGNDILYYKYWWTGLLIFLLMVGNVEKVKSNNCKQSLNCYR